MEDKMSRSAADYIDIMRKAAAEAIDLIGDMDQTSFAESKITLAAVSFCHFMVGQAACDLMRHHPEFEADHMQLPLSFLRTNRDYILEDGLAVSADEIWDVTQKNDQAADCRYRCGTQLSCAGRMN